MYVQAPKSDIYVAMLGISLGAILLGCLLLGLLLNSYEFKTTATGRLDLAPEPASAPALVARAAIPEILDTVRL